LEKSLWSPKIQSCSHVVSSSRLLRALARHEFRGKNALMIAILALQLIPPLISVIPTYLLMQTLGLYNTRAGIIALYSALSIPWAIWVLKGYMDTLPRELDESAAIDGASRLTTVLQGKRITIGDGR
jgi:multiple sugar transport system permease protein